jgi:hypothetical protein
VNDMIHDDYDWCEHDQVMSRVLGERMRRARQLREKWLTETATQIAAAHGVDAGAQRGLLAALLDTRVEILSGTTLNPDNWYIPRNLASWKAARAKLIALAKALGAATEILKNQDQVVFDALLLASKELLHRGLPDLVGAAFEFEQSPCGQPR